MTPSRALLVFLRRFHVFTLVGALSLALSNNAVAASQPTLSFTIAKPVNGVFPLTWSTTNAKSCVASDAWSGTKSTSGTANIGPFTAGTRVTFRLACTGDGGTVVKRVGGTVTPWPSVTLTAAPTSVASGASAQLNWSSTNSTTCTAAGGWTGTKALSGTQSTGARTADTSYSLTCTGRGGSQTASTTVKVTQPAPTLTFSAAPASIASGGTSQLTWSTTNATSCTASGGWTGTKGTSGTLATSALTANTSYTLACSGASGSISRTATVTVTSNAPVLTLTASPASVQSGSASQLTWSTSNATSCAASGSWTGSKGTSGSQSTGPLTGNASYTLSCAGNGTTVAKTATVTVTGGTATVGISANPQGVARNGSSTLSWTSAGVTSCSASGAWTGTKATAGSQSVGPLSQDSTYTLTCSGTAGNAVAMTTITLREAVLSWQAPTKNVDGSALTNLAGYKVYYGNGPRTYTQTVSISGASTLQRTIALTPGTWYFAVSAIDSQGVESAKSGEVSKVVK